MQDDDIMIPEGYTEGMDFFDLPDGPQAEPNGQDQAAEAAPTPEQTEASPAPTPEQGGAPDVVPPEQQGAPTPEQPAETGNKLRFKAKVDRNEMDVEIGQDELPAMYQRAQVTDRVQQRLQQLQPRLDQAEQLAHTLGYQNLDDMLQNAAGRFRENTVQSLVGDGVHQQVAEAVADFRLGQGAQPVRQDPPVAAPPPSEPDFKEQVAELRRVFPESADLTRLPDEVTNEVVRRGVPLVAAYATWTARQQAARAEQAERELQVLRQNQQNAAKAPVKGTAGGGAAATEPEDNFLKGFDNF